MTIHEQHQQQSSQQNQHQKHVTIESEATTPETVSPAGPPRKVSIDPEALALPPSQGLNRVPTPGAPRQQQHQESKGKNLEGRASKENLLDEEG
jgi:hypothetical protein